MNFINETILSIVSDPNMPPTKDYNTKSAFGRSHSNNGMSMSAKIYHPATNLMPLTPPQSPTGVAPSFGSGKSTSSTWGRQNSNGKYS
uniref:SFRICE_037510 n=1 Tax=Spodoptera frugiperda TaxID=7108 RepID=A0A2H1WNT0_SPOFR